MTDYAELEKRLRSRGHYEGPVTTSDGKVVGQGVTRNPDPLCVEAADAIAALSRERDYMEDRAAEWSDRTIALSRELEEAREIEAISERERGDLDGDKTPLIAELRQLADDIDCSVVSSSEYTVDIPHRAASTIARQAEALSSLKREVLEIPAAVERALVWRFGLDVAREASAAVKACL